MSHTYDIAALLNHSSEEETIRSIIGNAAYFDSHILTHRDDALRVWRNITRRYAAREQQLGLPYSLAESPKLYAVDALCIAGPLIDSQADLLTICEFFTVFYLIVHYFDDHVEHRDKFYSKFDFSKEDNIDTQRGAAPFSFMLLSLSILEDLLSELKAVTTEQKSMLMREVYQNLAAQTRYFAVERQSNLDVREVLEVKQRQVSGKSLSLLGSILGTYLNYSETRTQALKEGLVFLGSLTQITDDIRDIQIDTTLRNANIVIACNRLGASAGSAKLSTVYNQEAEQAAQLLERTYSAQDVRRLLSLPFYPFFVDKRKLESEERV